MAFFPVDYNPARKEFSYLRPRRDGSMKRVVISTDVVTPPDQNTYPLRMQPVANPGDPVTLGVGDDHIELLLSGNPASQSAGMNELNVLLNGRVIAVDLVVSSFAGMNQGQHFTLQGNWGPAPHKVTLASNLTTPGLKDMWITAVNYDDEPLVYNGPSVDSRGAKPPPNATSIWDNIGANVEFSDILVTVPDQPPAPNLTVITGATIDGKPTGDGTLAALINRTPTGSTLKLPSGRIVGTSQIGAITLAGAGPGQTIIDVTGLPVAFGKAALVPIESGAAIQDLTITGAAGPDNNAAGVRQQGDGIDFSMTRVEVYGCQDGVLTFPAHVTLTDCDFHDNGAGDGLSHEIYLSGDLNSVAILTNVRARCGAGATHAVKSRSGTTIMDGCSLTGSSDATGSIGGSVLDIPDGGGLKVTNSTITMGNGAAQRELISYALESAKNGVGTVELDQVEVKITAEVGYLHAGQTGAKLVIGTSTYAGTVAPTMVGWGDVEGEFTAA